MSLTHQNRIGVQVTQRKGQEPRVLRPFMPTCNLAAVVHVEFDRVGRHADLVDFIHLQGDAGIDPVVGEDAAAGQELTILVQRGQSFVGGWRRRSGSLHPLPAAGRTGSCRPGRPGGSCSGYRPDRPSTGREAQVRVGDRIREAGLDTAGLVGRDVRHADRGRTVLRRVGHLDRRFVERHEALVRVGARIGDGVQRLGVLDDAADVEQRGFRQAGVAVASEQVLAVLPDRLVHVHARTVVANDRLRHEGGGLAVLVRNVVHDVLEDLGPVGALDQRIEDGRFRTGWPSPLRGGGLRPARPATQASAPWPNGCHGADRRRHREVAAT